jgi:hypothetical protein
LTERAVPAEHRDFGPGLLARHPGGQHSEDELLQRLGAAQLAFRLPAIVELLVEAIEPLAAGADVNGVVAIAASRLQDVAEHQDPAVVGGGRSVDVEKDRDGRDHS